MWFEWSGVDFEEGRCEFSLWSVVDPMIGGAGERGGVVSGSLPVKCAVSIRVNPGVAPGLLPIYILRRRIVVLIYNFVYHLAST